MTQQIPADSLGDRALPVLIGAVVALLGTVVIQLFIVPAVEARKRREQRWEQDVREMGELLTFDLPRAVRIIDNQLSIMALVLGPRADNLTKGDAQRRSDHERELKEAVADLSATGLRMDWLRQRICDLAKDNPRTLDFAKKCGLLSIAALEFETLEWKTRPRSDAEFITMDEVEEVREKLDLRLHDVLRVLNRYGTGAPPRNSIRHRAVRQVRKTWARIRKASASPSPGP